MMTTDAQYLAALNLVQSNFNKALEVTGGKGIFVTPFPGQEELSNDDDVFKFHKEVPITGYFKVFLDALDHCGETVQQYRCRACQRFLVRYAGLAYIGTDGKVKSALFNRTNAKAPLGSFAKVFTDLALVVESHASIGTRVLVQGEWSAIGDGVLGERGTYFSSSHFKLNIRNSKQTPLPAKSAFETYSKIRENIATIRRALEEFPLELLESAVAVLNIDDQIYRSEKVLGPVKWLAGLQEKVQSLGGLDSPEGSNWMASEVSKAPEGFLSPRSSMAGTLLTDLASGMAYETVVKRFEDKMHPLKYARPVLAQIPASATHAQKAQVEKMGLLSSLPRRWATLADLQGQAGIWVPGAAPSEKLRSEKNPSPTEIMVKEFVETVLPGAVGLKVLKKSKTNLPLASLTMPLKDDQKSIWAWGDSQKWSWLVSGPHSYRVGHSKSSMGVYDPTLEIDIVKVVPLPQVHGLFKGFMFLVDPASGVFLETDKVGSGLFPEILCPELRPVRKFIESYSNNEASLSSNASSGGLVAVMAIDEAYRKEKGSRVTFQVTKKDGAVMTYNVVM